MFAGVAVVVALGGAWVLYSRNKGGKGSPAAGGLGGIEMGMGGGTPAEERVALAKPAKGGDESW
eukprot:6647085-Pyramimonas_sp.AAC.1